MATAGFEAAGHAPTLNPTLSSSASASATASASTSASASASASPSSLSSHSHAAFHTPATTTSLADLPNDSPSTSHHAHRQSHNSSKLPAFRFADYKHQSPRLALPLLLQQQHIPPSPVSPTSAAHENDADSAAAAVAAIGIGLSTDTAIPAANHTAAANAAFDTASNGSATPALAGTATTTTTSTSTPTTITTVTPTSDVGLPQQPHQHRNSSDTTTTTTTTTTTATAQHTQTARPTSLRLHHDRRPSHRQLSPRISSPIHELPEPPPKLSPRSRASTFQTASQTTPATPAISPRRPASYPDRSPVIVQQSIAESKTSAPASKLQTRRSAASRTREPDATDVKSPPPPIDTHHHHPSDASDDLSPATRNTKDWAQGQRELILPKTLQNSSPTDEKRKSVTSRPPISYRPPSNTTSTASVRVAPIRSFRSSGSRRSLGLDSSTSTMRSFDFGDEFADSNQRDRTLRALEGRIDDDLSRVTPPHSANPANIVDDDNTTGDVFMKIARQEPTTTRRGSGDVAPSEEASAIRDFISFRFRRRYPRRGALDAGIEFAPDNRHLTDNDQQARVTRISHRRPLSAAVPLSYHPTSPPQISRRLSDQQETSKKRARQSEDESVADPMARALAYRSGLSRDRPASVHPGEDLGRSKTFNITSRSSANTPRSFTFQDPLENSPYGRRRPSLTDGNTPYSARSSAYRQSNLSYGQTRTYNSSPLVPKTIETPRTETQHDAGNAAEGTESTATASTTAPSTVWDELDDLKSRIHRLELTGKLPATSGAAMSRASDERPPTATNTTMSTSPKRTSGSSHPNGDAISTTSSQRETQQPILLSAVNKSKPFLSDEVARALETAATEALALANMMGTAGQPGPISSGASTIGVGTNLTDRQLRRKADSICRSLTELVLALSEESAREKTIQVNVPTPKETAPSTPTINMTFTAGTASTAVSGSSGHHRRPSFGSELPQQQPQQQTLPRPTVNVVTSPRALSKYEERRSTMLSSSALPSPRFALPPGTIPSTPGEGGKTAHRKSSLFIGRTRRAVTEEPEDGRRSSMLLRTRRAGTEELEDSRDNARQEPPRQETGRQTSLLRTRRGTIGEDDDEPRFRAPSRAATELQTPARAVSHTYHPHTAANEVASPVSSALPRRRFGASALTSRLVAPSTPSLTTRRYLERTPERDVPSSAEKAAEERTQPVAQPRHFSLSHTSLLNRASSITRRPNRDSTITNTSTAAQAGSYR
ncbi:hypothetical protein CPLU01_02795 [Colletotrichum plurivorum]|uniref:Lpxtg-motif cell wall anchor domain-containing protein n=1 Tax=Colletotrichum plurivorum TaxID=2175906 RepID=A0A8H6KUI3_9PEZI|nr:hypothetical protein CPLU01_02795 [Colletotrichum plurivorum]